MKKRILTSLALTSLFLAHLTVAEPTAPATRPTEAIALFDGSEKSLTDNWTYRNGKPVGWTVADGVITSQQQDIVTKEKYTDFQLHVEFNEPKMGDEVKGQARGNSGVYLQGRYEIQVLDSFGLQPTKGDCGAIYNQKAPDVNACLAPGEWQTYDITFKAAKYDADGKKTAKARVTVVQNGKKIQDDVEINGTTGSEIMKESAKPGPIMLQYHHNSVNFRNVWIIPIKE